MEAEAATIGTTSVRRAVVSTPACVYCGCPARYRCTICERPYCQEYGCATIGHPGEPIIEMTEQDEGQDG